jgi:hypothetical protein
LPRPAGRKSSSINEQEPAAQLMRRWLLTHKDAELEGGSHCRRHPTSAPALLLPPLLPPHIDSVLIARDNRTTLQTASLSVLREGDIKHIWSAETLTTL